MTDENAALLIKRALERFRNGGVAVSIEFNGQGNVFIKGAGISWNVSPIPTLEGLEEGYLQIYSAHIADCKKEINGKP